MFLKQFIYISCILSLCLAGCSVPPKPSTLGQQQSTAVPKRSAQYGQYQNVNVTQINRDLNQVDYALASFWKRASPYMNPDCSAKRAPNGQRYTTRAKQLCAEKNALEARRTQLSTQKVGHNNYREALAYDKCQEKMAAKEKQFKQDQGETKTTAVALLTLLGAVIGAASGDENRAKGAALGAVAGAAAGAAVGTAVAGAKEKQFLNEQQVDDEICEIKISVDTLKRFNQQLIADIRYYKNEEKRLLAMKRSGMIAQAELRKYQQGVEQRQKETKLALDKVSQDLQQRKEQYAFQKQQSNQAQKSDTQWQQEIAGLEREKQILGRNLNDLLAINPSI